MTNFKWKDRAQDSLARNRAALGTRSARVGSYSFVMGALVLAILVAVNVLAGALPSRWTQIDISAAQLYSLTSDTKVVLTNLEQDVTIYWISQAGEEDTVIEKLLDRYEELTDHITVVKRDPDAYPAFAQQYTSETVYNNSLVVESGEKSRYISYNDIYQYDTSTYYTTGSVSAVFDGEGAVTSAIDYVVSEALPRIYRLTGHGESTLPETFTDQLERDNMECSDLSLLNVDAIPEDCDAILLYAPTSDISEEEADMLRDYLAQGGHLMVLAGPQQDGTLSNLEGLLADYGVTANEGIVVDDDRDHYAFSNPLVLMPDLNSSDVTDPLLESGYHVIIPLGQGLTVGQAPSGVTVTSLLDTSAEAFSKLAGYGMTDVAWEEGDLDGPFSLAVSVEESGGGKLVWIASDRLLEEPYSSYSAGANLNLVMNGLSWMIGQSEAVAIRTKSLNYNYLTISASTAAWLKLCMMGILPAGYLLFGVDEALRRRRLA